jgi:16S rRNA (cytidine1402-2'-O)-methyltransferase
MPQSNAIVYLVPSLLDESGIHTIPGYVREAVQQCQVFFVENERTARRFLKLLWKSNAPSEDIVIDDYEWYAIHKTEETVISIFKEKLKAGNTIGIISEAGCPGVADPGQLLVAAAQEMQASVRPLVGPSSILLALMASGMNGQQFRFVGYLPIDTSQRLQAIRELEQDSKKKQCTEIFIETPYRNNQLIETLLKTCNNATLLCLAVDITGDNEWIKTKTIAEWKKEKIDIHKRPAIFLLMA